MKKVFAIVILMSMIIGGIVVPVNAKSKQKTMILEFGCNNYELVTCSVPYYGKWEVDEDTLGTNEVVFYSSKYDEITIKLYTKADDPDVDIFLLGLLDKKNKKALMKFLKEDFWEVDVTSEDFSKVYKYKKDGSGRYMLVVNLGDKFAVMRALDDEHLMVYRFEALGDSVSKKQRDRVVSYAKNTVITEIAEDIYRKVKLDDSCPISLPTDKDWYIAMEGRGEKRHDFLWNSRESYSGEALSWETTMECWFMEFVLHNNEMRDYVELVNSVNGADREAAFRYWDEELYPKLRTATTIFDDSAELIDGTTKLIGETTKGYPIIQGLFEGKDHIITVYLTYNKEKNILQACILANGAGSRMKADIEKYVEEAIINQN